MQKFFGDRSLADIDAKWVTITGITQGATLKKNPTRK